METENDGANPSPLNRETRIKSSPVAVIASLIVGLAAGMVLRNSQGSPTVASFINVCDVIGTMWVNAIRMTVIPLVIPLLIGAVASSRSSRAVGRLGLYAGMLFLGSLTVFAVGTVLLAPIAFSGLHIDPQATAALRSAASTTSLPTGDASFGAWLKDLIPTNPIKAAADGSLLSLVVFALMFGFATLGAPPAIRARALELVATLREIMLLMIQAILKLAPIGVFALTLVVGAKLGGTAFSALSYYVAVECGAMAIATILLCTVAITWGQLPPRQFFRGASPAMLIAAGTSSSLSSLPAMIEGARDEWKLHEDVTGFVLPLAASTFKLSTATSWVVNATFISLLYGIHLTVGKTAVLLAYTVLMNATIPGIPGGGIIAASPLFLALGLPIEGLAILLAVNPLVDRVATVCGVTGDMTVAAIIGRLTRTNVG